MRTGWRAHTRSCFIVRLAANAIMAKVALLDTTRTMHAGTARTPRLLMLAKWHTTCPVFSSEANVSASEDCPSPISDRQTHDPARPIWQLKIGNREFLYTSAQCNP